jgi:predicted transcriptional regulator
MRDFEDDYDYFEEENEENLEKEIEHIFEHLSFPGEAIVEITNLGMIRSELKYKLLQSTIEMLEKSFFWKFKSPESKKNDVKRVYMSFNSLIDIDEE